MDTMKVVHVTHTDILHDSRVLKSIDAVNKLQGTKVYGFGIQDGSCEKRKDVSIHNYSIKTRSLFKFMPRLFRLLLLSPVFIFFEFTFVLVSALFKVKPNVVHAHDYLALFPCLVYAKFSGAKVIYDAHELESNKNGSGRVSSRIVFLFEKLAWKHVDAFITVSDSIQKWYFKEYGNKRSEVVLNSPDFENSGELVVTESFRDLFAIDEDKLIAVYVGLFVKGRGIEKILKLAAGMENFHFVFLGEGPLQGLIEDEASNSNNISIHSFVEHSRVVDLLKGADIGLCMLENVSLSDYYAIPNKLLEYAFSGLYVIATDFPDMKQVVESYNLGMCLPDDLENARENLSKITREDIVKRNSADFKILSNLTWCVQEEKIRKIYSDMQLSF
ncbi:glycosyltransferase [Reinekea forsetii]|nr:glycosyltransferase [Reinekea forsetii]